jgi:hypothetical protein
MSGCKACAVMRNEAYVLYAAMTHGKRNAADGRFSTASQTREILHATLRVTRIHPHSL